MSIPATTFSLSLERARINDFTEYLSIEGVTLTFDRHDLAALEAAKDVAKKLAYSGKAMEVPTSGPDVEFHGLGGLHELEVDAVTIDSRGQIVISAEVRHGRGEGVELVVALDELYEVAEK